MSDNYFRDLVILDSEGLSTDNYFIVERPDGLFMEVNSQAKDLLLCLRESSDTADGIRKFCNDYNISDPSVVEVFVNDRLIKSLNSNSQSGRSFLYKKMILNGDTVDRIAGHLSWLFNRNIGITLFLMALALDILFVTLSPNLMRFSGSINAVTLLCVGAFIIFSSLIHEFGHAAAARKFGVTTGGIGFGLYINFPIFFTDVSRVWRIPRLQKVVVNIAGVYFQLVFETHAAIPIPYRYGCAFAFQNQSQNQALTLYEITGFRDSSIDLLP